MFTYSVLAYSVVEHLLSNVWNDIVILVIQVHCGDCLIVVKRCGAMKSGLHQW